MARESKDQALSFSTVAQRGRRLGKRHQLVVWHEGVARSLLLPEQGEAFIGRQGPVELIIDEPTVSRRHAKISLGPPPSIEDLGSRNCTYVNGQRLEPNQPFPLAYGDVATFGDVVAVLEEHRAPGKTAQNDSETLVLSLGSRTLWVADPLMLNVYSQLRRLAASQLAVLIVGETGTGKDLAAATLHAWSQRSGKPLLTLNCTALPESLAESELFGHVRGAFSGAVGDRAGLFESAEGGTVFLDEIGDLPLTLQPKLLRVLENKSVTRIGSVQERPVDVRIVAATHRELAAEVRKNRFREDLFYRLGAAMVRVPPLRERPGELSLLAREFLCQARADLGREMFPITDGAMQRLAAHRWRGNVRELKNVMAYVATLFDGPVTDVHINHAFDSNSTSATLSATNDQDSNEFVGSLRDERDQLERRRIQAAIAQCNGNKTRAARALGLPLRTLTWKLRRYATRGA